MRVTRTIATFLAAVAMALAMVLQAIPAAAVAGFDSEFFGESAFVFLQPGQSNQFAVGFYNRGNIGWTVNTGSEVHLAQCCPINTPSPNSNWLVNPLSSFRYARHTTDFVGPGQIGFFVYTVQAPTTAAPGDYSFNGDLVLGSTGEALRREGYFQIATVPVGPTPTLLELNPVFQAKVLGDPAGLTAKVTADPPSGSTTRQPLQGIHVTFFVDGSGPIGPNADLTFTGITNASGEASISYTRSFSGTDTVDAFVTNRPTVRDTSTVAWGVAQAVAVTPDDGVTLANDKCRTYTATAKDPATGAVVVGTVLNANFQENIGATSDQDGGATIAGTSPDWTPTTASSPDADPTVQLGATDAAGKVAFDVCGAGTSTKTVTPFVWDNNGGATPETFDALDRGDAGGAVTFQAKQATITVTPDDSKTEATNGQRVFTATVVDQFGAPFTAAVRVSSVENTDSLASTSTTMVITWTDNDSSQRTTPATGGGCANAPTTTAPVPVPPGPSSATVTPNASTGQFTFAVCSTSATTGTPVVWHDANANTVRETDERQDTGGPTTWAAAAVTSFSLSPSSDTNPTSPDATVAAANDGSKGEHKVTYSLTDQSGNPVAPAASITVSYTITNTGANTIWVVSCDEGAGAGAVASGASATCSATITATTETSTNVEVDTDKAGSATIAASASTGSGSATKTWIFAFAEPATGAASGTVIFLDKLAGTTDGGEYIVQTAVGNFLITYATTDCFIVSGTTTDESGFEGSTAISVGDIVTWTKPGTAGQCALPSTNAERHEITTNNP